MQMSFGRKILQDGEANITHGQFGRDVPHRSTILQLRPTRDLYTVRTSVTFTSLRSQQLDELNMLHFKLVWR